MRELIRKILNEEVSPQVRRRIPTFEDTFKHYRNAFSKYTHRNFNIYWNTVIERVLETLYHAWFVNTVPDDDWEESEKYIQDYLTKKYYNETEKMWGKKHHKRLNESEKETNYLTIIENIVEPFKEDECICNIDMWYDDEDDMYSVYLVFGTEELNGKFTSDGKFVYVRKKQKEVEETIKGYLPIKNIRVGSYGTPHCEWSPLNESEDNEEKTIQKNLIVLKKLISMFDYSEVCDMWVEYNSEDGDYEIKSKMSTKNHNTKALEKEFEFLENSIKYLGFTNCYVFRPYYVEECEDEIKYMNESEDKNQSLLSLIDEHGLYEFMKMSGLPLKEIISKTGELSRESLEKYIKDFIEDEAQTIPGSDGDRGIVYPIPLSKTKEVESFYLSKDVLTVEVNEYDLKGKLVAGSIERLPNLTDDEIYKIVKELIDWGGDDDYYEI